MNYYEELGVGRDATGGEIRQAYKTLARLLHPDGQADERLKAMAGRQMMRLNLILEVLSDPLRRRAYDESLLVGPPALLEEGAGQGPAEESLPEEVRSLAFVPSVARYWLWLLTATACMAAAGIWWSMPRGSEVPEVLPLRPPREPRMVKVLPSDAARPAPPREGTVSAPEEVPAQAFLDPRVRVLSPEPALFDPSVSTGLARPSWPMTPNPPARSIPPAPVAGTQSQLVGEWLYAPPELGAVDPGAYPALYIELLVSEENGELQGSYFARYKVSDRTIPPEVLLRARGRPSLGKVTRLDWISDSGAKGVLEMTQRPSGLMSVAWWTIGLGGASS